MGKQKRTVFGRGQNWGAVPDDSPSQLHEGYLNDHQSYPTLSLDVLVLTPRIRQHTQAHSHTQSLISCARHRAWYTEVCSIHLINEYAISYILDSRFKSVGLGKVILAPGFFTPEFIAVSHQFLLSLHLDNWCGHRVCYVPNFFWEVLYIYLLMYTS